VLVAALVDTDGWTLADWFSVIGFPLGIVGFALAWVQLRRTRGAANAAKSAVEATQRQLADNHLLLYIPQLAQALRDLEHAVERNDHAACRMHLDDWRDAANRIRTLVRLKNERTELQERLNEAIPFVVAAKEALEDQRRGAKASTARARDHMRAAGDKATEIVTERMAFVEMQHHG
jgi:hypothetical protein